MSWVSWKAADSRIRALNRGLRLKRPSMFKISSWDVKEPTHYSKRVGREVPGVVAVLLSLAKRGRLDVMFLKRFVVYEATYAKTSTSQKGTLPSVRLCRCRLPYITRKVRCYSSRRLLMHSASPSSEFSLQHSPHYCKRTSKPSKNSSVFGTKNLLTAIIGVSRPGN